MADVLTAHGIPNTITNSELEFTNAEGRKVRVSNDPEIDWEAQNTRLLNSRSVSFNEEQQVSVHNTSVEFRVSYLAPNFFGPFENFTLTDRHGNSVVIGRASEQYVLNFLHSNQYSTYFKERLFERFFNSPITRRRIDVFFPRFFTAKYKKKGSKIPASLVDDAKQAVNRALVKLAIEHGAAISIWKPGRSISPSNPGSVAATTLPEADYNEDAVSYYKIGLSSLFPSQGFLSFYHVCEYFFLSTQESELHTRISTIINDVRFKPNSDNIEKLILSVRNQDARADEFEMLRAVMMKYVVEADLIDFIRHQEVALGRKCYTKRQKVFGEEVSIQDQQGHAISNAARVLKHVRNAIVHSSDRYKREDCHIPLSDTEEVIRDFIPLIKFVAEKVIFGTAR